MYNGQPPLHSEQNVRSFNHPDSSANMDMSQFGHFTYPFQGLPDHNGFMTLPGQGGDTHFSLQQNDAFHNGQVMASAAPASESHLSSNVPRASLDAGAAGQGSSLAGSDDGTHHSPPVADPLDDPAADEFELYGNRNRGDGTDLGNKTKDKETDATPSWSELKTKAGKERKRLPLACISCRRKKIRCSGEKPACKHCLRSRIPCVYKVTTRKAAPRTDYMAMLDKRLKRMEERIIKVIPSSDQTTTSTVTRAVVKPAIPGSLASGKGSSKKRGADEAFGSGQLEAWAKAPNKTKLDAAESKSASLEAHEDEEDELFKEGIDALPKRDIQEHLAEVFFDNVYGQAYHLLHKPSYMRKLKNGALPPVLVLSVCAVAARFAANPKLDSTTRQFLRGEEWASHARDICTRRYEWPNITILTCLLILGLHEFGTCQGGRSWALGGQAIRMAFALQLHKDLEFDPLVKGGKQKLSFIDREIRRRIMWACFLMDRFNSSGTDRPMFMKEETISIPLPVKERFFQLDMPAPTETLDGKVLPGPEGENGVAANPCDNMGVAAFMVRTIALWGRIISYVNHGGRDQDAHPTWNSVSKFGRLLKEAEDFPASLPEAMKYSADNLSLHSTENIANQFLLLHIAIQHNILFLNRAAISLTEQNVTTGSAQFVSHAQAKSLVAANKISDYLREAEGSRHLISAPYAGYCAFTSATVHIQAMFSLNTSQKATAEANSGVNIKYLRKMMKHWGTFHLLVENIRNLYREAMDGTRSGGQAEGGVMKQPLFQYGDWFDRYPHGVSDAEFMDPQKKKDKVADGVLEQKPELHTVEEFFTTLSSPSSKEKQANPPKGASAAKRRASTKRPSVSGAKGQQQPQQTGSPAPYQGGQGPNEAAVPPATQRRRVSAAQGIPTGGPSGLSTLTIPHTQGGSFDTMTPISPLTANQFGQNQGQPAFYRPDLLSMNLAGHQQGAMMQAMDRQMMLGGYSMEPNNMMNGVPGWSGVGTPGTQSDGSGPRGTSQGHMGGVDPNLSGESGSAAWLMPFEMAHAEMGIDVSTGPNGVDPYAGMYTNSGMSTPNPLGGLRHGH